MVTYRNWQEYSDAAKRLVKESPHKVRYCTKWRHELGLLVLKVTDDSKCLKFKTRSSLYLNRFEILTRQLLELMHNKKPPPPPPAPVPVVASTGAGPAATEGAVEGDQAAAAAAGDGTAGGGASKSKKKKGKKKK
ncbi:signal recognition particle, SRP9/SRP14 subunit [Meredithblackwellia eburnea MCA 4105]